LLRFAGKKTGKKQMFGAAKSRIPHLGRMKPYSPSEKLVVRDSLEDEISDDIEDDVFIRDGRTCKTAEEKGQKRPLMAPRRKQNKIDKTPIMKKRKKCWRCCEPFCYGLAAVTVIIGMSTFVQISGEFSDFCILIFFFLLSASPACSFFAEHFPIACTENKSLVSQRKGVQ
jgi:hypothetical protein